MTTNNQRVTRSVVGGAWGVESADILVSPGRSIHPIPMLPDSFSCRDPRASNSLGNSDYWIRLLDVCTITCPQLRLHRPYGIPEPPAPLPPSPA